MRRLIERIRMKLLIRRLSHDLNLTEEEVIRRLELIARDAARVSIEGGVTTEQMGNAIRRLGKAAIALEGK